mmetsp:Transcript_1658/g.3681  ORF Transcript_1658/g.3681 Transcript_1658/m.3681 type:complete len:248 (-) Transcript_1658:501-1244(-)
MLIDVPSHFIHVVLFWGRWNEAGTCYSLVQSDVPPRELSNQRFRCLWQLSVIVRIAIVLIPKSDELFVYILRLQCLFVAALITSGKPKSARIRGMNLVDEQNIPLVVHAELVFGIDKQQAIITGHLLSEVKELQSFLACLNPVLFRHEALVNNLLGSDRLVTKLRLCGWGDYVVIQFVVLAHAVLELVPAIRPCTALVVGPNRGAGGSGQVAPNHKLHREHLALLHDCNVWMGRAQQRILDEILGVF